MWLSPSKIPWPASAQKCLCSWFYFTPAYIQACKWAAMHLWCSKPWILLICNIVPRTCLLPVSVRHNLHLKWVLFDRYSFWSILSVITVANYPLSLTIILIGMQVSHIIMIILSSSMVKVNLSLLNKIHLYVFFSIDQDRFDDSNYHSLYWIKYNQNTPTQQGWNITKISLPDTNFPDIFRKQFLCKIFYNHFVTYYRHKCT